MKNLALTALVLVLATAVRGAGEARIYDGWLPGTEPENAGIVQVLDATTGEPIEGVSVRLHLEWAGTGFTGADLLGRTVTDSFGLASIRWPYEPTDGHWVFDKPGYAVVGLYGCYPPERVWLRKGETIGVRVLDPFGRPAAGVTAEMFMGCSHSPVVRIARTDAEGVFKLRDVEPGTGRVWIRAPGARTESFYVPPDGGTIVLDPGTSIEGTVVDAEEKPVEGVVVASLQSGRGPTAVTDDKGRFRLDGVESEGEVWFFHESWYDSERPFLVLTDVDLPAMAGPRPPLRLVLPTETVEDEDEYREFLAPSAFPASAVVVHAKSGEELPDVPLVLTSLDTGLGFLDEEEEDEDYEPTGRRIVIVEPGTYLVSPGSPFARYRIVSPQEEILSVGLKGTLVATAVEQAKFEVTGVTEEMYDVRVVLSHTSADVEDVEGLPPDEPAIIVVRNEGGVRFFPVPPAKDGVRRVAVEPARPASVPEEVTPPRPNFDALLLLDAAGKPISDHAVRIQRHNSSSSGSTNEDGRYVSRSSSGTFGGGGPVASPFVLTVEGYLTRVVAIEKSGDLTIRYPAGVIEMKVAAPDGTLLDFAWCVDGMLGRADGGKLTLRGVPPGRRTVVVAAKGHGSRLYVVNVPEEGAATLDAVLPK